MTRRSVERDTTPDRISSVGRGKAERDIIGLVSAGAFAGAEVSGPRGKRLFSAIERESLGGVTARH